MNETTIDAEVSVYEGCEIVAYDPFREQLNELKKANETIVFDYESEAGNKDARSHVAKLRKSKSAVEKKRKEIKAPVLERASVIDTEAKEIIAEVESMIEVHVKPLEAVEAKEQARKDQLERKVQDISGMGNVVGRNAEQIRAAMNDLEAMEITVEDYAEFAADAMRAREDALGIINVQLPIVEKAEADAKELAELRAKAKEAKEKLEEENAKLRREAEVARQNAEASTSGDPSVDLEPYSIPPVVVGDGGEPMVAVEASTGVSGVSMVASVPAASVLVTGESLSYGGVDIPASTQEFTPMQPPIKTFVDGMVDALSQCEAWFAERGEVEMRQLCAEALQGKCSEAA